jgi:hypothetical protein
MTGPLTWPGKTNRIAKMKFALMTGFDADGQPMYAKGALESAEELEMVQSILEPLHAVPRTIASVAMGEVTVELENGSKITLRPVFHPSLDTYRDLFFVDEWQYPMPAKLAELLEQWRKEAPR